MTVTPSGQRRPVNAPRASDLVAGAALSALVFAPLTAISITTLTGLAGQTDPAWLGMWLLFSFLYALFFGFIIAMLWGVPVAFLVARLARGSTNWRTHLAAHAGLGALTGALVWIIGGLASGSNSLPNILPIDQLPWLLGTAALTATSTATGWAAVWRASRLAPISLADDDSRAEDDLTEAS
jgi:hypothetical protein